MTAELQKDLIVSTITALLNVSQHDTLKLMRCLHRRMKSEITTRFDCSFQVLNAYDLYVKYIDVIESK